jgi:hypothetical protein
MSTLNGLDSLLSTFANNQRVVVLLMKSGDRHHLKVIEVRDGLVIGEARCLYHNHEIGKRIHLHAMEEGDQVEGMPPGGSALTMADAVARFGSESHRYKFYISLSDILMVAEDMDDPFDETPFFSSLF